MMSRKAKLTLFSKIVYEKMQRCRKKQNLGRRWLKKKKDSLVIVKILEVAAYSNRQQAQVWRGTRWKYFKLHLVDLNWFSDRSKFKALDHSVAFDILIKQRYK